MRPWLPTGLRASAEKRDLGVKQMRGMLKEFEEKTTDKDWALVCIFPGMMALS